MAKNSLLTATTAEDMLSFLNGSDYEQAMCLHRWAQVTGLKTEPRTRAHYYRIQYSTLKPKRSLFTIECNDKRWRVKSSLYHFAQYSDGQPLCASIKKAITATRSCTGCNPRCIKGARFTLDGKNYFTCIGSGHFFEGLSPEAWQQYLTLLQHEYEVLVS